MPETQRSSKKCFLETKAEKIDLIGERKLCTVDTWTYIRECETTGRVNIEASESEATEKAN